MTRIIGDCFEVLPTLPPQHYDLLLTDPPYAMPATFYQGRDTERRWSDTSIMSRWFIHFLSVCLPTLRPSAMALVFCDPVSSAVFLPLLYPRFPTITQIVWNKGAIGMGRPVRRQHELILVAAPKNAWVRDNGIRSVIQVPRPSAKTRRHPAQKPVALLAELITSFCPPGGRVLDPFAGSGSTLEAAKRCGYECDVIELDEGDEDAPPLLGLMEK